MELWAEILAQYLAKEPTNVIFPNLKLDPSEIVERECYLALKQIKQILEDDSLQDAECFMKIEEIISVLEFLGSNTGNRHNF